MEKPPRWTVIPRDLMTNLTHKVDKDVENHLRENRVMAGYPGANFNAECWFVEDHFHAAVYVGGKHRATVTAPTPQELMTAVSNDFGWA